MILEGQSLCKYYGKGENVIKAVDHASFHVNQGEFVSIVGQSGAGKSTLMHLIGGLDQPDSGKLLIKGTSIYELSEEKRAVFRRQHIGFIFQAYNLLPMLNVWENVILPLGLDGRNADQTFIEDILATLNIHDKRYELPTSLSGGQQQRVAIARALAAQPSIILADEPTGNLDSKTCQDVMDVLRFSVSKYNQTLIMVTHNNDLASLADRCIRVVDGRMLAEVRNG